jgi:hypothetical protein
MVVAAAAIVAVLVVVLALADERGDLHKNLRLAIYD